MGHEMNERAEELAAQSEEEAREAHARDLAARPAPPSGADTVTAADSFGITESCVEPFCSVHMSGDTPCPVKPWVPAACGHEDCGYNTELPDEERARLLAQIENAKAGACDG